MIDKRKLYQYYEILPNGQKDILDLAIETHIYHDEIEGRDKIRFVAGRPHSLSGKLIKETDDGFEWEWDHGLKGVRPSKLIFKVLTLKEFNEKFPNVAAELPKFKYEEELHEWYRTKYEPSYF